MLKSSYEQNNYGDVFYSVLTTYPPMVAVELGVLHGYSAVHIARALKYVGYGHLNAYDLFEDYQYNHGRFDEVQKELIDRGLQDYVTLYRSNAFEVYKDYQDNTVHFLHVDLSNTGEVVRKIMEQWDSKITHGGIIMFEGGSEDRDKIEWMIKYNKEPIKPELENNRIINERYVFGTYLKYPSLTMLLKKR
jgi:predicted O-methyltransferase YrrM